MSLIARLITVSGADLISSNVSDTADTYSATAPYVKDDEVSYSNRVYVCLVNVTTFTVAQSSNIDTANERIYKNGHNLSSGDRVAFASSGSLPGGLSATTLYYVRETGQDWTGSGQWFDVSATDGGSRVNITSTGSGTLTVYDSPVFGVTPGTDDTKWLDSRPVNKWAMFDEFTLTKTTNSSSIEVQVTPGSRFDCIGLLGLANASSVNIRVASEGASHTNYLTYSEQFDHANWTKSDGSVTANAVAAPNDSTTADKLVETVTGTTATPYVQQNSTTNPTSGATVVSSVYAKAGERSWLVLRTTGTTGHTLKKTWFNLSAGTVGTTASGHTATITSVGNGWYRCSVVTTQGSSTGTFTCGFGIGEADNDDVYDGDGTSGLYLWGAQFEIAAAITAYIPTTTAAVTTTLHTFYDETYSLTETAFSDDWYAGTYSETLYKDRLAVSDISPSATTNSAFITITGSGTLECGSCLFGLTKDIGKAQYGASVGIDNWTRIERDEFGGIEIDATRGYSDNADYECFFEKAKAGALRKLFADNKDTPVLLLMAPDDDHPGGWDAVGIHHCLVQFRTTLSYPSHYLCRIECEGLT